MESERSELAELNKMKEFEILNELKIESNTMTNPLDSRRRTCRRSIPVGLSLRGRPTDGTKGALEGTFSLIRTPTRRHGHHLPAARRARSAATQLAVKNHMKSSTI